MEHDPLELEDIAAGHREQVSKMYKDYLAWFKDVSATRGFDPSPIELGGTRENPSILTRQDWRGPLAGWNPNDLGFWQVRVVRDGRFNVRLNFAPRPFPTVLHLSLNEARREQALKSARPSTRSRTCRRGQEPAGSKRGSKATELEPACSIRRAAPRQLSLPCEMGGVHELAREV